MSRSAIHVYASSAAELRRLYEHDVPTMREVKHVTSLECEKFRNICPLCNQRVDTDEFMLQPKFFGCKQCWSRYMERHYRSVRQYWRSEDRSNASCAAMWQLFVDCALWCAPWWAVNYAIRQLSGRCPTCRRCDTRFVLTRTIGHNLECVECNALRKLGLYGGRRISCLTDKAVSITRTRACRLCARTHASVDAYSWVVSSVGVGTQPSKLFLTLYPILNELTVRSVDRTIIRNCLTKNTFLPFDFEFDLICLTCAERHYAC